MYKTFQGSLHIVDMEWQRGKPPARYIIYCTCGNSQFMDANFRGIVECPICKSRESMRAMRLAWFNVPNKNMIGRFTIAMENLEQKLITRMATLVAKKLEAEASEFSDIQSEMGKIKRYLSACQFLKMKPTATRT